ncbi:MAG: tetratricopeptide repeat protein, partial [Nitrososphaera sp.]
MPSKLRSKIKDRSAEIWSTGPKDIIQEGVSIGFYGDYTGALEDFERAIHLSGSRESDRKHIAWFHKGQALMQMGQYREAIDAFDKAIKYDPEDEL